MARAHARTNALGTAPDSIGELRHGLLYVRIVSGFQPGFEGISREQWQELVALLLSGPANIVRYYKMDISLGGFLDTIFLNGP